jgi:hypothetical protein
VVITTPANTAVGDQALASNTGFGNTAAGFQTLLSNTTGGDNTAVGTGALHNNTIGNNNTASGVDALLSNTTGSDNTADGEGALYFNTTGNYNTGSGFQALNQNTTGSNNTATGYRALYTNNADNNTAYGYQALLSSSTGSVNTAIGVGALQNDTTGGGNTGMGNSVLQSNTTGNDNIAIGVAALYYNSTGSSNIAMGHAAGTGVTTANNVISIGDHVAGANVSNSCYIGEIFGATSSGGTQVFINSSGRLGTMTSSRRFKEEIKPMEQASEALLALKPVTFRYKKEIDPQSIPQFGLIAEEVEKVNPNLVVRDTDGKVNTVRYEAVNAMLLNEFLKEHKKVEEQQVTITDLKKDLGVLTAQLKEQAAEIQKVSAEFEMRRPLTRVARTYP